MKKINEESYQEILRLYEIEKLSPTKIGKLFNVSYSTIRIILKKCGCVFNPVGLARIYSENQHYFDVIDNEHKAYWLGLLYADGCNRKISGHISIALQERDVEILEKFKIDLESNRPIHSRNFKNNPTYQNQSTLCILSPQMCISLEKLGCVPNKSLTLQFPTEDQVPKHLLRHWLRGMLDGDGCIGYYYYDRANTKGENIRKLELHCALTGTTEICLGIRNFIEETLNLGVCITFDKDKTKNTRHASITGIQQIRYFLNWLYRDSTIYLDRKYKKYLEICDILHNLNLDRDDLLPKRWEDDFVPRIHVR